jgi:hypothetical protein
MLTRGNAGRKLADVTLLLTADDVKSVRGMVGIAAAGAAAVAMLIGAPIVIPFVTLAGYPIVVEKWQAHQLSQAKAKLRPELRSAVDKAIALFTANIVRAITEEIRFVQREAEDRYDDLLQQVSRQVRIAVTKGEDSRALADRSIDTLRLQATSLETLYSELQRVRTALQPPSGVSL